MNEQAKEQARASFVMEGEEPLDKVSFDCGYKAGYTAASRSQWVRVSDELPEPNVPVYVTVQRRTGRTVLRDTWDGTLEDAKDFRDSYIAWMPKQMAPEPMEETNQ